MIPRELMEWRPEKSMRSVAELATHLACAPLSLYEALAGNLVDEQSYINLEKKNIASNVQGFVKVYENGLIKLISYLEEHTRDAHEKKIQFFYQTEKSSIYEEVFSDIGHQWFHLGQLFVYLRQNGVEIDMGAYYGYKDPDESIPPNK
jgi:uncharacterized damage-inducible protein DinB